MLEGIDNSLIESDKAVDENVSKRKSVRYVRNDLTVYLTKYYFCKFGKPIKTRLIDISSGGVQIASSKNFRTNKKLTVDIHFNDGFFFKINGKIIRRKRKYVYAYDLAFDSIEHEINAKKATIDKIFLFGSGLPIKSRYRNVTTDGIQILTGKKLDNKSQFTLKFQFNNNETYTTHAKLIRYSRPIKNYYGIKFEQLNPTLGNYLLQTQKHLVFG